MVWIFIGTGAVAALLGLSILTIRLPRPRLPRLHPQRIVRGCLALLCLAAALGCGGLALLAVL
jgi:hypothetical protein